MDSPRSPAISSGAAFSQAAWWTNWTFGYYDEEWYVNLFSPAGDHPARGEITPSYSILNPSDIARIQAINPDMKLVFMIRNPIERAWSGLRFSVAIGSTEIRLNSVNEVIARLETPRMLLRGDYERTLDNYLQFFPSSQILVCFYDAISRDPEGLIDSIARFLGVREFPANLVDAKTRVNASPKREMPEPIREYLLKKYTPMINRFSQRFGSYAAAWESGESNGAESASGRHEASWPPTLHP